MTEQQRKEILIEVVKRFGKQEWFRDAVVYDKYPTTDTPTLEIKVNYVPIFDRKSVMDFAQGINLKEKFTVVDKNGNPSE
jgi:hypothetical protein